MKTALLVHAQQDRDVARQLAEFLASGCSLSCSLDDGLIVEGEDLISRAEYGLSADNVILLLSRASAPGKLPRERWDPVLSNRDLVSLRLEDCSFPALLQRRNFFDATVDRLTAQRMLKRWFWQREHGVSQTVRPDFTLPALYAALADRAGTQTASGDDASLFFAEAAEDFEALFWVPCHNRSLAQAAGELGVQLGMTLDGPAEENCTHIRNVLGRRRCLVILDAPVPAMAGKLTAGGRTSTLITAGAVRVIPAADSFECAQRLSADRRYAEAYELLYGLMDASINPEACARELTWICDHWGRWQEANELRCRYPSEGGEQLRLF